MDQGLLPQVEQGVAKGSLSVWDLFIGAEPVVQLVMLVLLAASFWSWTIIFQKYMRLRSVNARASEFEDQFWSGGSLDDLYDGRQTQSTDPLSVIFCSAMREWRRSTSKGLPGQGPSTTIQQRIDRVMQTALGREMDALEKNMGFLASTGSTATFIGLFGTVLGIMHSFESIAAQQSTNLAVVAPGIAEALFATAIGLVVAIPAVIAYNKLSSDLTRYGNRLEAFCAEFTAIVSRQLEGQG